MKRFYIFSLFRALLLEVCMLQFAISSSNFTDQSALLFFKRSIHFHPTKHAALFSNWTVETNFCHWSGVSCSLRRQRVTSLNLTDVGLGGTISPYIGNLSFLVVLDLRKNSLSGYIPMEIGNLRRLRILYLESNFLEGSIPPSIHRCRNLEALSLSLNNLTGAIPEEMGSLPSLRRLSLGANNFVGPIPASLGNLSSLQFVSFAQNDFTGSTIPSSFFNLSSLVLIDFTKNNMLGTLPVDLCSRWLNIRQILFSFNQFSGPIPSSINECKDVVVLSLSTNRFEGSIPRGMGNLTKLERLYLGPNNLTGTIPPTISNVTTLKLLAMEQNYMIEGTIPNDLVRLSNLEDLSLAANKLTGVIPSGIFNMSSLRTISLTDNGLSGNLAIDAGTRLPFLQILYIGMNKLHGNISPHISNLSQLVDVSLGNNLLRGPVPSSLGELENLQSLTLHNNQLTGEPGNQELHFLSALSKCRYLKGVALNDNPLNGIIPDSIGNLSSSLQQIKLCGCQLKGHIPKGIGSFKNLIVLAMCNNRLSGNIPPTIGGLVSLQGLYLDNNSLQGSVPQELCQLRHLGELFLGGNNISGSIPGCIGDLTRLQNIVLNSNILTSSIPSSLWDLENVLGLDLSSNLLSGQLPQNIRTSRVLQILDLSQNNLRGNIPSMLGSFESLTLLDLSRNYFQGSIPETLGGLQSLTYLDLSKNNLSGTIPISLEDVKLLKFLNLSFNYLSGEIPRSGPFVNFTFQSFLNNKALCGKPILRVSPCSTPSTHGSKRKTVLIICIISGIALTATVTGCYYLKKRQQMNMQAPTSISLSPTWEHRVISYREVRGATEDFRESNLLGIGSFGSVYKGTLSDGTTVAVKVLNLQNEGALESFDAECKVLRSVRHRSLVKVISSCSNTEFRALVLEYMHNGSLDKWLYSHNCCLNLLQRVTIMADAASALEYLHYGQAEPVVHCDLKPSNILLDEDMVAHVSDFGIAKILAGTKDETQTKTLGTLGYMAPEYGSEGKVSTKGDIYSFGITLLEVFTRKRPTDAIFTGEKSLSHWVSASLPNKVFEIADDGLLEVETGADVDFMQRTLLSLMELGLDCTKKLPKERANAEYVAIMLNKIKLSFLQ